MHRRPHVAALVTLALAAGLTACTDDETPPALGAELAGGQPITVFAAASLATAFEQVGERFTEETGVEVRFSYAGSQDLVAQVLEGAPADVLATADERTMQRVVSEAPELVRAPARTFAKNALLIATPLGNPAGIRSFADLDGDVALVACAPEVPCGAAAQRVAEATGVELHPVSEESSVTDVVAKVLAGEADAGLVYETEVIYENIGIVPCDECEVAMNSYQAAPLAGDSPEAAAAFADFLLSETAVGIFADLGFRQA